MNPSWRTATHCNTLHHTAPHCNTTRIILVRVKTPSWRTATRYNTRQHTATHCNTLQHTTTHYNTLQHTATHCNTLQHTATQREAFLYVKWHSSWRDSFACMKWLFSFTMSHVHVVYDSGQERDNISMTHGERETLHPWLIVRERHDICDMTQSERETGYSWLMRDLLFMTRERETRSIHDSLCERDILLMTRERERHSSHDSLYERDSYSWLRDVFFKTLQRERDTLLRTQRHIIKDSETYSSWLDIHDSLGEREIMSVTWLMARERRSTCEICISVTHLFDPWLMVRETHSTHDSWWERHIIFARHDSFTCAVLRIHMCDMIHSYMWHDSFICVTWFIHICDMTRSCDTLTNV